MTVRSGVVGATRYLHWESPGTAAPVVLMHGMGAVARSWQPVAERLAARRPVYALDRRGHGGSADTPPLSFARFRDDLLTFLTDTGLRGVVGVGHSAGGTDLLLAAAESEVFEHLIVVEPTLLDAAARSGEPELSPLSETMVARMAKRPDVFRSAALAEKFLLAQSALELSSWHPEALAGYLADGVRARADGAAAIVCAAASEAAMLRDILLVMEGRYAGSEFDRLDAVGCPVDLVRCGRSRDTFQMMGALGARLLPRCTVRREPDASHFLVQTDPARFAALVETLIAERTRNSAGDVLDRAVR